MDTGEFAPWRRYRGLDSHDKLGLASWHVRWQRHHDAAVVVDIGCNSKGDRSE
jgi:hypothetical protein